MKKREKICFQYILRLKMHIMYLETYKCVSGLMYNHIYYSTYIWTYVLHTDRSTYRWNWEHEYARNQIIEYLKRTQQTLVRARAHTHSVSVQNVWRPCFTLKYMLCGCETYIHSSRAKDRIIYIFIFSICIRAIERRNKKKIIQSGPVKQRTRSKATTTTNKQMHSRRSFARTRRGHAHTWGKCNTQPTTTTKIKKKRKTKIGRQTIFRTHIFIIC